MKTYKEAFEALAKEKRAALIPFFVIGDPDPETSLEIVKAAIDAGADVLELGIPFSDPIADGPTIQKADIRAMQNGMRVEKALDFIKAIKAYKDIPIGLLMYYNLIFQYGAEKFCKDFCDAGVNSVLVADLSNDDADEIIKPAKAAGLDTVFMVTPNMSPARMKKVASKTTGFIYTVSLLGVTGSRETLSNSAGELVRKLKKITNLPICVGFGISRPEHAAQVAKAGADGVIIGSKVVQIIEENLKNKNGIPAQIRNFLSDIRETL